MAYLDQHQILQACYDSTKGALRVSTSGGSLGGQITWSTGLGAITHILGPSDQPLKITGGTNQITTLNAIGTGHLYLGTAGDANAIEIEDTAGDVSVNQDLTVEGATSLKGTVGLGNAAGDTVTITGQVAGSIEFTGAATHELIGEDGQILGVRSVGTGHLYLGTDGDANAIEIEDTGGDVTINQALTVAGETNLNGGVDLGNAAEDTITFGGQISGSMEFTGAATHELIGEDGQILGVRSVGTGHLYLGTTGDANAIEIEDTAGNVTITPQLTVTGAVDANSTGDFADTLTCSKASGNGLVVTSNCDLNGSIDVAGDSVLNGTVTLNDDVVFEQASASSSSNVLTIDCSTASIFTVTLTENVTTLTLSNGTAGHKVMIIFTQDGGGGHTVAFGSIKFPGGTAPTITAAGGSIDIVTLYYDGSSWYGDYSQNFS